jgi:hypothetical protein
MNAKVGAVAQAIVGAPTVSAVGGKATFDNLAIEKTGTFALAPSGAFGSVPLTPVGGYSVVITPAAAHSIAPITAALPAASAANTQYSITVEVKDVYGNLRPNTPVYFSFTPNPLNTAAAQQTTGSNGQATYTWTVNGGDNTLFAALDNPPQEGRFVTYETSVSGTSSMSLSCSERGSRLAINTHAVRIPAAPQNGASVRAITSVQFYFSVNGSASAPVDYPITVTAHYQNGLGAPATSVASNTVRLLGNAAQDLAGGFIFAPAFVPRAGTPVVFSFSSDVATTREVRFNAGRCALGDTNCAANCAAKSISTTISNGFDLFTNPIVRESAKIDLFSAN